MTALRVLSSLALSFSTFLNSPNEIRQLRSRSTGKPRDDARPNSPRNETANGAVRFVSFIGLARPQLLSRRHRQRCIETTCDLSVIIEIEIIGLFILLTPVKCTKCKKNIPIMLMRGTIISIHLGRDYLLFFALQNFDEKFYIILCTVKKRRYSLKFETVQRYNVSNLK